MLTATKRLSLGALAAVLLTTTIPSLVFAQQNQASPQDGSDYSGSEEVSNNDNAEFDTNVTLWYTEQNDTIDDYKVSRKPTHENSATEPLQWEMSSPNSVDIEWFYPEGTSNGKWDVLANDELVANDVTSTQLTIDIDGQTAISVVGAVEDSASGQEGAGHIVSDTIPELPDLSGETVESAQEAVAEATGEYEFQLNSAYVSWDAFIPDAYIQPAGTTVMCQEAKDVDDPWYNGNGEYDESTGEYTERQFYTGHSYAKDSKTFTRGSFSFGTLKSSDKVYPSKSYRYIGETELFNRVQVPGEHDRYDLVDRATASADGINAEVFQAGPFEGGINIRHNVGNPLCSGAPGITYDLRGKVNRNGNFIMEGVTDKAPSHALNIRWLENWRGLEIPSREGTSCVIQEDTESFMNLAPGFPNYFFSISGHVLSHHCKPGTVDPYPPIG